MAIERSAQTNRTLRAALLGFIGGTALAAGVAVLASDGGVPAMHHMSGPMSQADMAAHIDKVCQHVYVEIDATDAQKSILDPIFKQAAADLLPMFQQLHTGHAQVLNLLAAPTIDRTALEQASAAQIAVHDQIAQRMTRLVEDSSNVLTPDQRQKLVAHLTQHMAMPSPMHG
ncbi:Spy/CpxP family protein refolding chaperone [Dyella silvae]|uniref:Spy/CpxP family protein refolding chaperone n=1 Tax=Dyella silvae TaxID=2994424 RepID=UPI0022644008|nr:Spy/CpxP family protein refolding chaperone [Dyella silvae]